MNSKIETSAESILSTLTQHADELRAAGIRHLSLFGSMARGEAGSDSDIDLAAEIDPEANLDLLGLIALERRLEEILGRRVDLVPEPVEKMRLQRNIDRDRNRAF